MEAGYVQVYTGNGKGKTTAALGLALRGAGAGKKVYIAQFVKGMHYAELDALKRLSPDIIIKQYGLDCFIEISPTEKDIEAARAGLKEIATIIHEGQYDIVILDEVCIALHFKLFALEELLGIVKNRPQAMEIVLTGRYCPQELLDFADLVTEMKEVKHYYQKGVKARKGIEF